MTQSEKSSTSPGSNPGTLVSQFLVSAFLAAYVYVFMEWLFFVTKPSFFDTISTGGKLSILFRTSLLLAVFGCLALSVLMVLSWGLSRVVSGKNIQYLPAVVPAGILSVLTLLALDNFTYTIFKVGVITTVGLWRGAYAVLFILIFLFICRWFLRNFIMEPAGTRAGRQRYSRNKVLQRLTLILLATSFVVALFDRSMIAGLGDALPGSRLQDRPNILLFGGDGINAANMSAYGYERETTPNISALAGTSLFVENAFTNAGNSAGSVITILTGKNATATRVLYSPDILKGTDSFQHLPGILQQQGYYTAELGFTHYIDAYELNLQSGFDEVNGKAARRSGVLRLLEPFGYEVAYFTAELFDRIRDRLLHIFYIQKMENAYGAILQPSADAETSGDRKKIRFLLDLVAESDRPFFLHIHIMVTHGPMFYTRNHVFSEGESQTGPWLTDFYDDAILTYDEYVGEVLRELAKAGSLDNTIIVIYTDHNMQWATDQRIPLIFYFPKGEYAGRVQHNAQNIDIAPTLLDYLGLAIPDWMEGKSLLQGEPKDDRLVFSMGATHLKDSAGLRGLDLEKIKPPFYQFGYVNIINCQNWYRYDLVENRWESGLVNGHTSACGQDQLLSPGQIRDALLAHLTSKGFDTTSLVDKIGMPAPVMVP
jgi:arylsulfatase A-like enzyme